MERPSGIRATHLARGARVYSRVSSPRQVKESKGSLAHQRSQADYPRAWGWPESAIRIVDNDLGLSGSSTHRRYGYLELVEEIVRGVIGAVFVWDLSRLGRDAKELMDVLEKCRRHDVLIVVDGRPHDLSDESMLFSQKVNGLVVEFENRRRCKLMQDGRMAKAKLGLKVTAPPTGYIKVKKNVWGMDPNPAVHEPMHAVFRAYLKRRSLKGTVDELNDLGVKIPRRCRPSGIIEHTDPTVNRVHLILRNPVYKGEYHYPQTKVASNHDPAEIGVKRLRRAEDHETIVIPNAHDCYITPEVWDEIRVSLKTNAPTPHNRSPGSGNAMLQGRIRCGPHGNQAMSSHYIRERKDGSRTFNYQCIGTYLKGGQQCGAFSGMRLDDAVLKAVFERLSPPRLEVVRDEWTTARRDALSEDRRKSVDLHRARQAVDDAKFRALSVSPHNRNVAEEYENLWEKAKTELRRIESQAAGQPSALDSFTEEAWKELLTLTTNVRAIFEAPTTSNLHRKQLIGLLVKEVVVESRSREEIRGRIEWKDGSADSFIEIKLSPYAHKRIAALADQGLEASAIATELNKEGLRTTQNNPWNTDSVRQALKLRSRGSKRQAA